MSSHVDRSSAAQGHRSKEAHFGENVDDPMQWKEQEQVAATLACRRLKCDAPVSWLRLGREVDFTTLG